MQGIMLMNMERIITGLNNGEVRWNRKMEPLSRVQRGKVQSVSKSLLVTYVALREKSGIRVEHTLRV